MKVNFNLYNLYNNSPKSVKNNVEANQDNQRHNSNIAFGSKDRTQLSIIVGTAVLIVSLIVGGPIYVINESLKEIESFKGKKLKTDSVVKPVISIQESIKLNSRLKLNSTLKNVRW